MFWLVYFGIGLFFALYFIWIDRKEHKIYNWDSVFMGGLIIWPIQVWDNLPMWFEKRKAGEFTFKDGFKTEKEAHPQRFV